MRRTSAWPEACDPRDPFVENAEPTDVGTLRFERIPPDAIANLPALADMARVAADISPGVGNESADRLLGPFADELDLTDPLGRHQRLVAMAAACFFAPDDDERSPFLQWSRRSPTPPAAARAAFRAVERVPWALFRIDTVADRAVTLTDCTGLGSRYVPIGAVQVDGPLPLEPGHGLLARLVPRPDGTWAAALALTTPVVPPGAKIQGWIREAAALAHTPVIEQALRSHGHVFVRRTLTYGWRARP